LDLARRDVAAVGPERTAFARTFATTAIAARVVGTAEIRIAPVRANGTSFARQAERTAAVARLIGPDRRAIVATAWGSNVDGAWRQRTEAGADRVDDSVAEAGAIDRDHAAIETTAALARRPYDRDANRLHRPADDALEAADIEAAMEDAPAAGIVHRDETALANEAVIAARWENVAAEARSEEIGRWRECPVKRAITLGIETRRERQTIVVAPNAFGRQWRPTDVVVAVAPCDPCRSPLRAGDPDPTFAIFVGPSAVVVYGP
jgi:hypothetical protein